MNATQRANRDNLLIETVRQCRGQENSISEEQLRQVLRSHGYTYGLRNIHQRLRKLMFDRGLPIGFKNAKGYYWITNAEEIESVITDLTGRIVRLQAYINHLNELSDSYKVSVVRCTECDFVDTMIDPIKKTKKWYCGKHDHWIEVCPVDYCSFGIRRSDNEEV